MRYLLTTLILLPVAGALIAVVYGIVARNRDDGHYKWIALGTTGLTFVVSLLLLRGTGWGPEFRFEENIGWIGSIGARYHLGVDGMSLWLVLLTTLLMPIAISGIVMTFGDSCG